jgi:hypothetical protein
MRERYPRELLLVLALGACNFNPPGNAGSDANRDGSGGIDAALVDAPDSDRHLLLTEVDAPSTFEFVEIYNPTASAVDLSTYYLSDHNEYWKLPGHLAGNNLIALDVSDFVVKFPDGAMLAPNAVATIAISDAGFKAEYMVLPTYTILLPTVGATPMVPIVVPAGTPNPGITNEGEMVVLFHWDGTSDRVEDVDLVVTGNAPSVDNSPIQKAAVDGPDPNLQDSSYATDALTIGDMAADASGKKTFKRILLEDTNEQQTGAGNGITGHDETSEQIGVTWDTALTNGTPGTVPASLQ